ncbi:hypothetical protein PR048_005789 [Dryococelus australis]|uniref:Uncharacterized protein n=1 Tax=Dryococelus australis TaxID=614101 RepID=A0ABQ9I981_9NEOP|nr:hypothetical protein PR048_005789 [Dryococelus australis]
MQGWGKRENLEKTCQPGASISTIPISENLFDALIVYDSTSRTAMIERVATRTVETYTMALVTVLLGVNPIDTSRAWKSTEKHILRQLHLVVVALVLLQQRRINSQWRGPQQLTCCEIFVERLECRDYGIVLYRKGLFNPRSFMLESVAGDGLQTNLNLPPCLTPDFIPEPPAQQIRGAPIDCATGEYIAPRFFSPLSRHSDTDDNITRDKRPVAPMRKALNLRAVCFRCYAFLRK